MEQFGRTTYLVHGIVVPLRLARNTCMNPCVVCAHAESLRGLLTPSKPASRFCFAVCFRIPGHPALSGFSSIFVFLAQKVYQFGASRRLALRQHGRKEAR